jgi:hypothetical protein
MTKTGHEIPDFERWMLQLAWYHAVNCTVKQPSARCSCGLHKLISQIRQERTDRLVVEVPPASKTVTRYSIYGDMYGEACDSADPKGEWVRYDDIRHLLAVEPRAPTAINAEGSRLMMELFNRMPVKALKEVPENIAKSIGDFMVANGYRFVFDRWHLQAEPKEPERSALNRTSAHE